MCSFTIWKDGWGNPFEASLEFIWTLTGQLTFDWLLWLIINSYMCLCQRYKLTIFGPADCSLVWLARTLTVPLLLLHCLKTGDGRDGCPPLVAEEMKSSSSLVCAAEANVQPWPLKRSHWQDAPQRGTAPTRGWLQRHLLSRLHTRSGNADSWAVNITLLRCRAESDLPRGLCAGPLGLI